MVKLHPIFVISTSEFEFDYCLWLCSIILFCY